MIRAVDLMQFRVFVQIRNILNTPWFCVVYCIVNPLRGVLWSKGDEDPVGGIPTKSGSISSVGGLHWGMDNIYCYYLVY